MKLTLILVGALLASATSFAKAEAPVYPLTEVHVIGFTKHFQDRKKPGTQWNEQPVQAIGMRHAFDDTLSAQIDLGKDSVYRASVYLNGDYTPFGTTNLRAGAFIGTKLNKEQGITFHGGLIARWQEPKHSFAFRIWPTVGNNSGGFVLQYGLAF